MVKVEEITQKLPIKRSIIANPFILILSGYGFANLYALILIAINGFLVVDQPVFDLDIADAGIASLGVFSTLVASWMAYHFCLHFKKPSREIRFGSMAGLLLLGLQLCYLAYNTIFELNIAGVANVGAGNLKYVFYLLPSDVIFIVISVGLKSNRWFVTNAIAYLISSMLSGWIGGIFILAIIVFCRFYPIRIAPRRAVQFLLVGIGLVVILPVIVEVKWAIRSGADIKLAISNLFASGYMSSIVNSLGYVLNRFQHLGHVTLLVENSAEMNAAFNAGYFSSYWHDGLLQQLFLKIFGMELYTLDRYMVSYFFGNQNPAANTNPGVSGWFFILRGEALFYVCYLFIITLPVYLFVYRYAGLKYLLLLACFSLVYLWHGWIGAYVNLVIYMLFFIFINRASVRPPAPCVGN